MRLRPDVEVVRLVQGADTDGVAVPGPSTSTTPPDPLAVAWTPPAMRSIGLAAAQPAAGHPASLPPPVALGALVPVLEDHQFGWCRVGREPPTMNAWSMSMSSSWEGGRPGCR